MTVEASNDAGNTASIDGESLSSLRLVVRDLTAPYSNADFPTTGIFDYSCTVHHRRPDGRESGVDITTLAVTIDEKPESSVTTEAIAGGYGYDFTDVGGWAPYGRYRCQ